MSAPMKKPIMTDYVELCIRVPRTKLKELKEKLAFYGPVITLRESPIEYNLNSPSDRERSESVPWEEIYPHFNGSVALRGARKRESLTQKDLAQLLGISQTHISEMEQGKRAIGKDLAKGLAEVLKVDYRVFL